MRIFSVLLWILFPGCWTVTGPGAVSGSPGRSVTVRCRYREGYEAYQKFWCREGLSWFCSLGLHVVETDGSEAEVKRGRVSIRDNHPQRVFTVTVENLTLADAGTYNCGAGKNWDLDPMATVELTVSSADFTLIPTPRTPPPPTEQPHSPHPTQTESTFSPTTHTTPARFQPIIIWFLLLGSLKFLFLCIVCAVIWLSLPYRRKEPQGHGARQTRAMI